MPEWADQVEQFSLFEKLADRQAIDYTTYELLHRGKLKESVCGPEGAFVVIPPNAESKGLPGERYYEWREAIPHPAK